ncbi:hypothetical protein ACEWY4_005131 [Coilia grayii]|uniref:Adhesion G-protein coupled receptor G2-like n=1 Tax=Coilia grayii TaxID=363190 RepID=A0ABD1KHF7_9TELE
MFVAVHSEEDNTDTLKCHFHQRVCPKAVVINSTPHPVWKPSTCSDNCSSIFSKLCIYHFYSPNNSLMHNGQCNDSKTIIYNVTKTENTYNVTMNVYDNIRLSIVDNWTYKPHCQSQNSTAQQNNHPLPYCCNDTGSMVSPEIFPLQQCKIAPYDKRTCKENRAQTGYYILQASKNRNATCVTCTKDVKEPDTEVDMAQMGIKNPVGKDGTIDPAKACALMDNMKSLQNTLGNAPSASLVFGELKGIITRVNKAKVSLAYSEESMGILSNPNSPKQNFGWSVDIPVEAVKQSQSVNNGSGFVAIMRFPNMTADAKKSSVLGAVFAIDMAANISNLTDPINIYFQNNKKEGTTVSCNSWDGDGIQPNWTEEGCTTNESSSTIQCQCYHLTFFAILMSVPPTNGTISQSDLNSLTYISYIGCGLSLFFLGVALFMHYLLRKAKSSPAIQILMNLFIALFLLNLTFLSNEWVANTGNYPGCIIIATLMHYSMLATFTWFAMQALHLYLHLVRMADLRTYKHYMLKMCIPAWVCPAVIVIIIAIVGKYEEMAITTDTGYTTKMCWIKDELVHYMVNVGYYAVVFLFSLGIFIVTVQRILAARKMKVKDAKKPSTSKNLMIILSLLVLLGITWGVAFFSYGPMLIPSYYIFCILNSFQGLFLFIYYYHNSRDLPENLTTLKSSVSSNTSVSNIYDNTTTHG